jgi:citrate lyase subunit beta/citryl-CoA lyase
MGRPDGDFYRSILFVPGVRPDRFVKATESGADVVVLDLEDSVDATRKIDARRCIAEYLAQAGEPAARRYVRVNAAGSPWWDDDLQFVSELTGCDGVVVPKAEAVRAIEDAATAVSSRTVLPLLETACGILTAMALASANAAIPALLFGAEDLTAEIGIPRTVDGEELLFARSQVVLAATAAEADAVDAVFVDLASSTELRRDAARARALGFRGKMAIHPDQIATINDVFSPTDDEIRRATRVVDAYAAAAAAGEGVFRLDNRMVDAPVVARARRILSRRRSS